MLIDNLTQTGDGKEIMYVDDQTTGGGDSSYRRVLLRESYREDGKVKTRTLGNISKCPNDEIEAIKLALKMKADLPALKAISEGDCENSKSVGAVAALYQVTQKLSIFKALGRSNEALLCLWMVIARFFGANSRLAAVRYANIHAACEILGLKPFNENKLYFALDWLYENQERIEKSLFKHQKKNIRNKPNGNIGNIYLYDLSSSYLEGDKNELAAFGYNRDGKKGKKQICHGLLTDSTGDPISVEVFKGNTSDSKTLESQLEKLTKRFQCKHITIVGDKGMIKKAQIDVISNSKYLHYITTITKPQIRSLIKEGVFQYDLFDKTLAEICDTENDIRYLLRRNPLRCEEIRENRLSKLKLIRKRIIESNKYLSEHLRAKAEIQLRKMGALVKRFKAQKYFIVEIDQTNNRSLTFKILRDELKEIRKLDGCYVVKTDLPIEAAEAQEVHDRYKDLINVELAFRREKDELNLRPIYLRTKERTCAHFFIAMLSYKTQIYFRNAWADQNITVDEGLKYLINIVANKIKIAARTINRVPNPNQTCQNLLKALGVRIPTYLPHVDFNVVTKAKLQNRRKRV